MDRLAQRVAERHLAALKSSSSGYGPHLVKIVQVFEELEKVEKKIPGALQAIEQIKHLIAKDPDVAALPGMNKEAPLQQAEFMEEALKDAEKALHGMGRVYDDANSSFLRMGLK